MSFNWLPPVDSCCFIIWDLKIATLIISIITMARGFGYVTSSYIPYCKNTHTDGSMGVVVRILSALLGTSGLILFLLSVVLAFCTLILPYTHSLFIDIYVITIFVTVILALMYLVLVLVYMMSVQFYCDYNKTWGVFHWSWGKNLEGHAFLWTTFADTILTGLCLVYFAIVVNSYDDCYADAPPGGRRVILTLR